MECYRLTQTQELEKTALTEAEAAAAEQAADGWVMAYEIEWRCSATSDSGIDAREIKKQPTRAIGAECIVMKDGSPIGCCWEGHLFVFNNPDTHTYVRRRDYGYVGGWGEIDETDYFRLQAK